MAITEETTNISSEEVASFLHKINDPNPIHRSPCDILPGMYGILLAEQLVERPMSELYVEFIKSTKYPCELETSLTQSEDGAIFMVSKGEEVIYQGKMKFNDDDNSELNPERFFAIYKVGGALLRHAKGYFEEGETGIYLSQSMSFEPGVNPLEGDLELGEITGGRKEKVIPANYILGDKVLANGVSKVRPIKERTLMRMMDMQQYH